MNKVILIGNLTKDPEIRSTTTGKKVAAFSLAINEGKDQSGKEMVSYFNLTAWDKKAEIIEMYVKKGHKVAVTGRLTINSWERQDGTKASSPEIVVTEIELLTSRFEAERINSNVSSSTSSQNSSFPAKTYPVNNQGNNSTNSINNTETGNSKTNNEKESDGDAQTPIPDIDINDIDFNVQMPF
jgi:single-strand DNA-binding protein